MTLKYNFGFSRKLWKYSLTLPFALYSFLPLHHQTWVEFLLLILHVAILTALGNTSISLFCSSPALDSTDPSFPAMKHRQSAHTFFLHFLLTFQTFQVLPYYYFYIIKIYTIYISFCDIVPTDLHCLGQKSSFKLPKSTYLSRLLSIFW